MQKSTTKEKANTKASTSRIYMYSSSVALPSCDAWTLTTLIHLFLQVLLHDRGHVSALAALRLQPLPLGFVCPAPGASALRAASRPPRAGRLCLGALPAAAGRGQLSEVDAQSPAAAAERAGQAAGGLSSADGR